MKAAQRVSKNKNKEKYRDYSKQWYLKKMKDEAYREKRRQNHREREKRYRTEHPEEQRIIDRRHNERKTPERRRAAKARYYARYPEKYEIKKAIHLLQPNGKWVRLPPEIVELKVLQLRLRSEVRKFKEAGNG